MLFERSAFSSTASKKTRAHTTIFPGSSGRNIYRTLQKCLVAFQAPAEGISKDPCKNALLLPCTEHLKNTAKKHPQRPQFFQNHLKEYRKNPAKYTGSCTGHPKKSAKKRHEQNKTFGDTPLSPPGSKKHPRRPRFVSNPSQEYLKTLQESSVAPLYRASKEHCKNSLWLMHEATYTNIADFFEKHLFHQQPAETYAR